MKKKSRHIINFNPGPASLPQEVLQQASEAVLDYNGTGLSILEIPHRGKLFDNIMEESRSLVKDLCGLNEDYEVLWLHGGGRLQFCMVPMNFLGAHETAAYIDSGAWANEAIEYARHYGQVAVVSSSRPANYTHLPPWPESLESGFSYLHFTTNNTIYGTQWPAIPKTEVPLIADMSSDIFSRQLDYHHCGLFYAVAQKNIGPAGVTLVVIRKDMQQRIKRSLPPMLDYAAHIKKNAVLNTMPVFAIYTSLLYLRWTKARGIAAIEQENNAKAKLLYDELSRNSLFHTIVAEGDRSRMNIVFSAADKADEKAFPDFCEENSVTGIKGHRSVGAFRVSLYNAISLQEVQHLVALMQHYEQRNA